MQREDSRVVYTEQSESRTWSGGQAIRLLIVDDSPRDVWLIQRMINKHRFRAHEIWTASTGEDALELLAAARPDCILLNDLLPDMTGLTFLDRLALPDGILPTAVVMLTNTPEPSAMIEAMKRGSLDYVDKTQLDTEHLHHAISNAIEKARLRIELCYRHAELTQFVSQASRKIRVPLRVALRNLHALRVLADDAQSAEAQEEITSGMRRYIDALQDEIAAAEELLTAVDTYSHFMHRPGPLTQVNMLHVAETVLARLHEPIEQAGATVVLEALPTLLGDEKSLSHLLRNLLQNSLDARRDVPLRIEISANARGHYWQLTVADNGRGIEASWIPHIFEPFSRLSLATGRRKAGMGLAICARIVEHHGGSIWLNSKKGQGTEVHFTLPQIGYRPPVDSAARPLGEEWSEAPAAGAQSHRHNSDPTR